MRNLLFISMILFAFACQQEKKSTEETADTTSTQEAPTDVAVMEGSAVVNANLATEDELLEAGLSDDQVNEILEARPFIDMMDLDAWVNNYFEGEAKTDLYRKVFVPMNLNTTAEDDFKIIPGVGDRMAHEFEEYRPYTSVAQFRKEIGKYVDEVELERFLQYVFVPVELNSASEEDILALPGVGERMTHEFEEYRPYSSMEQFRKEIGKYVDEKELSRLERLVYLKAE